MANLNSALKILWELEHDNNPEKVLHVNKGENGYTFFGIYQSAHPGLTLWNVVRQKLQQYNGDVKLAGSILSDNPRVLELVEHFYQREFWGKMKLDEVTSQHIANEMMIFGVNTHPITAIKVAQRIVGTKQDGIIGKVTLSALNGFDEGVFSEMFDVLEKEHYDKIVMARPEKMIYLLGWRNRAVAV
jgi:lysozyme family protein